MSKSSSQKNINPPQHQNRQPGIESEMKPLPIFESDSYKAAGKLKGKTAIITGGDSGIGRAVAVAFAKEGADLAIVYLNEHDDAEKTKEVVESWREMLAYSWRRRRRGFLQKCHRADD